MNAKISNSNRKEKIYLRLLDFLHIAQSEKRILLTDNYHLKIIDSIDKIFPSSKLRQNINVEIIEDEIGNVINKKDIYLEHMILLYNCSIFMQSTKNNFYKKSDKLIDSQFFINSSDFQEDNIELIVNSYEADRTKNISEWFDSLMTEIDYE